MRMRRHITIACPHCGQTGNYPVDAEENAPTVALVHCDRDQGGCDAPFAVEIRIAVTVDYRTCALRFPPTTG